MFFRYLMRTAGDIYGTVKEFAKEFQLKDAGEKIIGHMVNIALKTEKMWNDRDRRYIFLLVLLISTG